MHNTPNLQNVIAYLKCAQNTYISLQMGKYI